MQQFSICFVSVTLLTAGTLTTDTTLQTLNTEKTLQTLENVTVPVSISTDKNYTFNITKSGNSIIAKVAGETDNGSGDSGSGSTPVTPSKPGGNPSASTTLPERTKSLAETMAGSVSLLNGGVDMTVGQSFDNAAAAVEAEKAESGGGQQGAAAASGFAPFATIGGSNMRAKSGSYVDTYLKYYYTHQGGDRVTISSNVGNPETFDFDSVNSSRLRVGLRFTHALNQRQEVYTGLAYQYEFDGEARATYNGTSTPSPSIKGSSGMLELGFRTKVSSNMDLDLSVNGWAGKQRGVNAQLGMQWKF